MSNFSYYSDLYKRTPLQLAMRNDAFDAVDSILGYMGEEQSSSDDINCFVTAEDCMDLMFYASPLVKNGLDCIF